MNGSPQISQWFGGVWMDGQTDGGKGEGAGADTKGMEITVSAPWAKNGRIRGKNGGVVKKNDPAMRQNCAKYPNLEHPEEGGGRRDHVSPRFPLEKYPNPLQIH